MSSVGHLGIQLRLTAALALLAMALPVHAGRAGTPATRLRIGVDKSPPYTNWNESTREASGLAVAVLEEAARRRGITLEWLHEYGGGDAPLIAGRADLWAVIGITPQRLKRIYVTKPYLRNHYCLLSLQDSPVRSPREAGGRTVAFVDGPVTRQRVSLFLSTAVQAPARGRLDAVNTLCRHQAEAAFLEFRYAQSLMLSRPSPCRGLDFQLWPVPEAALDMGIGARFSQAAVADSLRDEIESMRADGSFLKMLAAWDPLTVFDTDQLFHEQERRHHERLYTAAGSALFAVALVLFWHSRRIAQARRVAEQASTVKSEFIANVSHEIRTPLGGILSTSEVLLDMPMEETQRDYVAIIRDSARTLSALLNDLLDLKKIEAGKLALMSEDFQPVSIVTRAANSFRPQAEHKGLALNLTIGEGVPLSVNGDPLRFRQVLANLLSNAVKFTARGGVEIDVTARTSGEGWTWVRVSVKDSGIGISEEARHRLFEKFSQADSSVTKRFGGTGLGLALSKALVNMMSGSIGAGDGVDGGAEFWFEVPFRHGTGESAPGLDSSHSVTSLEALRSALRTGIRVLLVEDNAVNARVGAALLGRAGCEVEVARDGSEAIERLRTGKHELVFMDCFMPGMDGYEAARRIRANEPPGVRTPIIALTAAAMAEERQRAFQAGMDDYLTKPVDLAALGRILERWSSHRPAGCK
jgi:signal transduction histidine kinase/ActR/RegA family two-component response regulator